MILDILAKSIQIFEVGDMADINSALFDVRYDYIGNQCVHEYYKYFDPVYEFEVVGEV